VRAVSLKVLQRRGKSEVDASNPLKVFPPCIGSCGPAREQGLAGKRPCWGRMIRVPAPWETLS